MTNLRFSTAQQVVDAFPILKDDFKEDDLQSHPVEFVRRLIAADKVQGALALCAFMLPRRDAVRWLCESLRKYGKDFSESEEAHLTLAENWVQNPVEKNRSANLNAAMTSGFKTAPAWAAAAAGWSGGNIGNDPEKPVPPPPHLTGQAVKVGFIMSYWNVFGDTRELRAAEAVRHALELLQVAK